MKLEFFYLLSYYRIRKLNSLNLLQGMALKNRWRPSQSTFTGHVSKGKWVTKVIAG